MLKAGMAVLIHGPLDFAAGVIEAVSSTHIKLAPGCVTMRDIVEHARLVATGKPCGMQYYPCPEGHIYPQIHATGFTLLPQFDPADWPMLETNKD